MLVPALKAFKIFKKNHPSSIAVIALSEEKDVLPVKKTGGNLLKEIKILYGKTYDILKAADMAIIASGTATVEAGISQTPMVIIYKLSYISWFISKLLVRVKRFGLVNIIFSEEIVPELIQGEVNPQRIANELEKIHKQREKILKRLRKLKKMLGNKGVYDRVADKILSMVY